MLTPQAKHLLGWLRDKCDRAGVIELDLEFASWHIGEPVTEKHLAELESRLQHLPSGKLLMPKFITFQNGHLSSTCPAHQRIIKLIELHGLERVGLEYRYPTPTHGLPTSYPSTTLVDTIAPKIASATESGKLASVALPTPYPSPRVVERKKRGSTEEEEVQGETISTIKGSSVLPATLCTTQFKAAWVMWLEHLKQKKKFPTLHAQDLQLAKLAKMGVAKAIHSIHFCIEHNWQGIYENGGNGPKGTPRKMTDEEMVRAAQSI